MELKQLYETAKEYADKIKQEKPNLVLGSGAYLCLIVTDSDKIVSGVTGVRVNEGAVETVPAEYHTVGSLKVEFGAKAKQLTNVRASGTDDKARIIPKTVMSLEECLEYIKEDELVEVTPKSMRMRKIILDHDQRKKANKQ